MTPGCLFVALPGYKTDGHRYIRQALERGAAAVLCQRPPEGEGPWLVTEDTRARRPQHLAVGVARAARGSPRTPPGPTPPRGRGPPPPHRALNPP